MFNRRLGLLFSLALALFAAPVVVDAAGGSGGGGGGGGGSTTTLTVRVTGYITAIDYDNNRIIVGQSYYGTGVIGINSSSKISINNVNCSLAELQLNDWAEVRYDWYTKVASKVSVTR